MAKKASASAGAIASYDDIFQTQNVAQVDNSFEQVREIPLLELFPFENHPFKVLDDDKMQDTAESIKKHGVLIPAIARPKATGGYELIAGHRRKRGCELAGLDMMPVIVRELDDDAATIIMVDSNLQRETLLFSERAFAYKMKLDAMKRQGSRSDLTCAQLGHKLNGKKSVEIVAEQIGESRNQIKRYIRLTELVPDLLNMVDIKKIAFNPAVELSYLQQAEQIILLDIMAKEEATPSLSQAQKLKKYSQEGKLTEDIIDTIMSARKKDVTKVTLTGDRLKKYFPGEFTPKQMEDTIIKLLDGWSKKQPHSQQLT